MIEHQKAVAKSVLKKLQTLDLYVVLAGGACRDWVLDKEATDLDFYLYYNPKYPSSSLKKVLTGLFDGVGEENGDQWQCVFLNGKYKKVVAEITFKDFKDVEWSE